MKSIEERYNGLLEKIDNELHIEKGEHEKENDWCGRVIYSVAARMGYASLWDIQEDIQADETTDDNIDSVSITHFKRRIQHIIKTYLKLYPEVNFLFPSIELQDDEDVTSPKRKTLVKELLDIFLSTGCMYHFQKRILPCMPKAARLGNVILTRGFTIDMPQRVSGAGTYIDENEKVSFSLEDPINLFHLEKNTLENYWQQLIEDRTWRDWEGDKNLLEYLRMNRPFTGKYWVNGPDKSGKISLARAKEAGTALYYLYRFDGQRMEVSSLPSWMIEEHRYRDISNACLFHYDALPPTRYQIDGNVVKIKLGYLYPVAELNLLKLYSWPLRYTGFPSDFKRIMDKRVFLGFKQLLGERGFQFEEGDVTDVKRS